MLTVWIKGSVLYNQSFGKTRIGRPWGFGIEFKSTLRSHCTSKNWENWNGNKALSKNRGINYSFTTARNYAVGIHSDKECVRQWSQLGMLPVWAVPQKPLNVMELSINFSELLIKPKWVRQQDLKTVEEVHKTVT